MEIFTPFNLNDNIKVKIKDRGYLHLYEQDNHYFGSSKYVKIKTIEERIAMADEDGYTTMQAHQFISYFGTLGFDLHSYVDINILIGGKQ